MCRFFERVGDLGVAVPIAAALLARGVLGACAERQPWPIRTWPSIRKNGPVSRQIQAKGSIELSTAWSVRVCVWVGVPPLALPVLFIVFFFGGRGGVGVAPTSTSAFNPVQGSLRGTSQTTMCYETKGGERPIPRLEERERGRRVGLGERGKARESESESEGERGRAREREGERARARERGR